MNYELCIMNYALKIARTPLARSPCSKSITDNTDTTDLFFTDFLFGLLFYLDFYAPVRRFDFYGFNSKFAEECDAVA